MVWRRDYLVFVEDCRQGYLTRTRNVAETQTARELVMAGWISSCLFLALLLIVIRFPLLVLLLLLPPLLGFISSSRTIDVPIKDPGHSR